jgi:hypothetical protein
MSKNDLPIITMHLTANTPAHDCESQGLRVALNVSRHDLRARV